MESAEGDSYAESESGVELPVHQVGTGSSGKILLAAGAAALGSLAPALVIPIAVGAAFFEVVRENLQTLQEERLLSMLHAASLQAAIDPQKLAERIIERDDFALLAAEAIDSARRSRLDGKAAALGRSLGTLLQDDALIDKESIWIRILSVVEAPHVRVLKHFISAKITKSGIYWSPGTALSVQTVSDALGLGDAILPLVQDLLRCGLLMEPGGVEGGLTAHRVIPDSFSAELIATQLGAELFIRLEAVGESEK